MSFLGKLFGNDSSNANNEQVICWAVDILNIIEKAGTALSINSCVVQVIAGNNVQIRIQDWYDDFIPRFGAEYNLDRFFELVPASGTSDIYVSKITPHISGSSKRFIIKHILPLRLRGNCLACVMNEVLINSEGKLFKCLQHTTEDSHKVGDCTTGVVFNENYLEWLDVSIKREQCQKCAYLPMCSGGCKEYWYENRPEISPCAREKTYFNTLTNLIHEWVETGTIRERQ